MQDKDVIFPLLLLGHILGDFYFQPNKIEKRKEEKFFWPFVHSLIYSFWVLVVLSIGVQFKWWLIWIWPVTSVFHFALENLPLASKKPLIIDQGIHIVSLGIVWLMICDGTQVRDLVKTSAGILSDKPFVIVLLGALIILRPVGRLINSGEIFTISVINDEKTDGAGRMIGYLERLIVYFLLILGQYSAVAFVISAKSIMRFPEISKETGKAEYYLIGTLLSMASVFMVTVLLGLIKLP